MNCSHWMHFGYVCVIGCLKFVTLGTFVRMIIPFLCTVCTVKFGRFLGIWGWDCYYNVSFYSHLYMLILIGWQLWSGQREAPHTHLHSSCRTQTKLFWFTLITAGFIAIVLSLLWWIYRRTFNLRFSSSGDCSSVLHQENNDSGLFHLL